MHIPYSSYTYSTNFSIITFQNETKLILFRHINKRWNYHLNYKSTFLLNSNALHLMRKCNSFSIPSLKSGQMLCSKGVLVYLPTSVSNLLLHLPILIFTILEITLLLRSSRRYFSNSKLFLTL